jgi:hypothetical protein
LELSFENIELRKICEEEEAAILKYGDTIATQLQNRLSDIFAAETVLDLPVGNPHKIGEHPYLFYVINLTNDIQFKFCAANKIKSFNQNGELDWSKITRIKLLNIQNSYE